MESSCTRVVVIMLAAAAALLLVTATATAAVHPQPQQDQVKTSTSHATTPATAAYSGTSSGSDGDMVPKVPWARALSGGPAFTTAVGGCGGRGGVSCATSETFERGGSADDRTILARAPWCDTDDRTGIAGALSRAPWVRNAEPSTMEDCTEVRFHVVSCFFPLRFVTSYECGTWQVVLVQRLMPTSSIWVGYVFDKISP